MALWLDLDLLLLNLPEWLGRSGGSGWGLRPRIWSCLMGGKGWGEMADAGPAMDAMSASATATVSTCNTVLFMVSLPMVRIISVSSFSDRKRSINRAKRPCLRPTP